MVIQRLLSVPLGRAGDLLCQYSHRNLTYQRCAVDFLVYAHAIGGALHLKFGKQRQIALWVVFLEPSEAAIVGRAQALNLIAVTPLAKNIPNASRLISGARLNVASSTSLAPGMDNPLS